MKALLVLWVVLALTVATLQADGEELSSGKPDRRLIDRKTSAGTAGAKKDGATTTTTTTSATTNNPTSSTAGAATTITSKLSSSVNSMNPSQGTYGDDATTETDPGTTHVFTEVLQPPKQKVPKRN